MISRFTYKLTHMYYNWPGTIRVPAPCQVRGREADRHREGWRERELDIERKGERGGCTQVGIIEVEF